MLHIQDSIWLKKLLLPQLLPLHYTFSGQIIVRFIISIVSFFWPFLFPFSTVESAPLTDMKKKAEQFTFTPFDSIKSRSEVYRVRRHRSRSYRSGNRSDLTIEQWLFLLWIYQNRCAFCGINLSNRKRTMEHVYPHGLGGSTSMVNIVPCCLSCNTNRAKTLTNLLANEGKSDA